MRWIDTHVHIFSKNDSDNSGMPLLFARQALNTSDVYFDVLGDKKPEAVVVVDFSMSKNSEHVINSLDDLKAKGIKAAGVIKADLNEPRTYEWLKRKDVKGVRFYAKDSTPDLSGEKWADFFAGVKSNGQHALVFGGGTHLLGLVKQIPADIAILIDHLGLPKIDGADENFNLLLDFAKERGNVYFKGPGYRTSMDVEKVKPIVKKIVAKLGVEKLMLGASDAPFAGPVLDPSPEYAGKKFAEVMDCDKVLRFTSELAASAGNDDVDVEKILCGNAKRVYGF